MPASGVPIVSPEGESSARVRAVGRGRGERRGVVHRPERKKNGVRMEASMISAGVSRVAGV